MSRSEGRERPMTVEVSGLVVEDRYGRRVVDDVDLSVGDGEATGIVGESGSGKTTLTLALLGQVRPGLRHVDGAVRVDGVDVLTAPVHRRRDLRRHRIAYLGQDPAAALTPTMRVGALVRERLASPDTAAVARALHAVGLPGDGGFLRRRPGQLSGGQRQRLALARALANDPAVVVLDEPTTGLDVLTQDLVLTELERLRAERALTLVVVSHDLAVVARLADDVAVLRHGQVVEHGGTAHLFGRPDHPYTRHLVAASPDPAEALGPPAGTAGPEVAGGAVAGGSDPGDAGPVLVVDGLSAVHRDRRGRTVVAAADVAFEVHAGECVALVGSSGAGKTTLARSIAGLHPPSAGAVRLDGVLLQPSVGQRSPGSRGGVQLVPQDPFSSLNPRRRVEDAVVRPLRRLHGLDRSSARDAAADLLARVRLDSRVAGCLPAELSGGERQRVAIARALAARPRILICDEVTSALDVSVQASVLDLLADLRRDLGLAVVFITHDLGVVARVADRVLVLDQGRVCEHGTLADVLAAPDHEITRQLVQASPSLSRTLA